MIEGKSYAFQKHNHCSIRGTIIRKGNLETLASWPDDCPIADYVKSFEVQVKCGYNYCPSLSFPFHLSVPAPLSEPQQCSRNVNIACVLVPRNKPYESVKHSSSTAAGCRTKWCAPFQIAVACCSPCGHVVTASHSVE